MKHRRYYKNFIERLEKNEVFCFGSNDLGYHCGGTAAVAYTNEWCIHGQSRGHMIGDCGESYGVATCTRPGASRSIPLIEIYYQLVELNKFAKNNPDKLFFSTIIGGGFSGYNFEEIAVLYGTIQGKYGLADNLILPESLKEYVELDIETTQSIKS